MEDDDDLEEGVGESSWPREAAAAPGGSDGFTDIQKQIYDRLVELGNEEAINDPAFREQLGRHFERLPLSYSIDLTVDKAEDVLLHRRILDQCADPANRPVFHVRFVKSLQVRADSGDRPQASSSPPGKRDDHRGLEPYERMMEDLSLERRKRVEHDSEASSARRDVEIHHLHEVIFSTIDRPKLLSKLSAWLSELGLNIHEAHVFSTTDGFCLDVFVVDGWNSEIDRIARVAFEVARKRRGKLCSVDKANVLEASMLWRKRVTALASEFPGIELSHMYVDNAAMQLIRNPKQFDTIVTNNIFGDIVSDEASMITGSIGMLLSASVGESGPGLFEPIHGSAPDIAGQDKANPLATILSAAMLLRYGLGEENAAKRIEAAVIETLNHGFRTGDIYSPGTTLVGCKRMGEEVLKTVES